MTLCDYYTWGLLPSVAQPPLPLHEFLPLQPLSLVLQPLKNSSNPSYCHSRLPNQQAPNSRGRRTDKLENDFARIDRIRRSLTFAIGKKSALPTLALRFNDLNRTLPLLGLGSIEFSQV
jgi:hypothetical protein